MTDRPRHFASVISDKVTELIRAELKLAPKEYHGMIVDEALNSILITWNLKKLRIEK